MGWDGVGWDGWMDIVVLYIKQANNILQCSTFTSLSKSIQVNDTYQNYYTPMFQAKHLGQYESDKKIKLKPK